SIVNLSSQLSKGMTKPNENFILDMFFGLANRKSLILSNIARSLEESLAPIQTIKRLSSRLEAFQEEDQLIENYQTVIQPHFQDMDHLTIDNNSEIRKSYSN